MKTSELRKLIREEVRRVIKETATSQDIKGVKDYFYDYDVKLTSKFNLDAFASSEGLTVQQAVMALVNLEDEDVMRAIAAGNYSTFDLYNEDQFNDMYEDMISDMRKMRKKTP